MQAVCSDQLNLSIHPAWFQHNPSVHFQPISKHFTIAAYENFLHWKAKWCKKYVYPQKPNCIIHSQHYSHTFTLKLYDTELSLLKMSCKLLSWICFIRCSSSMQLFVLRLTFFCITDTQKKHFLVHLCFVQCVLFLNESSSFSLAVQSNWNRRNVGHDVRLIIPHPCWTSSPGHIF